MNESQELVLYDYLPLMSNLHLTEVKQLRHRKTLYCTIRYLIHFL